MYTCLDCGYEFDEPHIYYENQAPERRLQWLERWKVCPRCYSPAYDETWKVIRFVEGNDNADR